MKLIHKTYFDIINIFENKISTYPFTEYAILDDNIILYSYEQGTEIDPLTGELEIITVENYPKKYRKSLVLNGTYQKKQLQYEICTDIVLMDQSEKDIVDLNIDIENINNEYFKNKKYRIESDGLSLLTSQYSWIESWCNRNPNIETDVQYISEDTIKFIAYTNHISNNFQSLMDANPTLFTIEINNYFV